LTQTVRGEVATGVVHQAALSTPRRTGRAVCRPGRVRGGRLGWAGLQVLPEDRVRYGASGRSPRSRAADLLLVVRARPHGQHLEI